VGVPYPAGYEQTALEDVKKQQAKISANLKLGGATSDPDKEIIAVIAYLQRLGTDIKSAPVAPIAMPVKVAQSNLKSENGN
jgi:cytochrome c oxidase cbb3-type subunit I/II